MPMRRSGRHFAVGPEVIAVELDRRISVYKEANG